MPDLIDPTRASDPSLRRAAFIGLSATTALAAPAAALAVDTFDFGKPHAPIVAEDDPAIVVARPQFPSAGRTVDAYYAGPKYSGGPGVVVVQAIWGVDAQLRDTVRRFAKLGYHAIAPNLFSGLGAPTGDGATNFQTFQPFAAKLADDVVDSDLAAAAEYLQFSSYGPPVNRAKSLPHKIGVTGFCMGGSVALRQAVDHADVFSAVAVFYGKVRYGTTGDNGDITPIALAYADDVKIPVLGSFGRRDTSILAADVSALDAKLTALGKPHDVKVYDTAGHAFFDDTRDSYDAFAAEDAWKRTLAWFANYLH
jgi:carboxymethylenebutenolidase